MTGQDGKYDIPVLCSNEQTFITSTDKAECFADIFTEKSTIPEAENEKPVPMCTGTQVLNKIVFWPKKVKKSTEG